MATISFGKPFHERVDGCGKVKPGPPEPKFPGVSPTGFDPSQQVQAYGDIMRKELYHRSKGQEVEMQVTALQGKQLQGNLLSTVAARFGDIMPGYDSLNAYYDQLGYRRHPVSGKPTPHEELEPPEPWQQVQLPRLAAAQSQVHSDISSWVDGACRSSNTMASGISPERSRLSSQAPQLRRSSFSGISASSPIGGRGLSNHEVLARCSSAPSNNFNPSPAREARLRALLLSAEDPNVRSKFLPSSGVPSRRMPFR